MGFPLVTASGYIQQGRLRIYHRRLFDEQIRGLKDGWDVDIEISRFRATRSQKQNAYYHGVVLQWLMDYTGIGADVLHDLMKVKFLSRTEVVLNRDGEIVDRLIIGTSTRPLQTHEFAAYVDAIRQWAAEKLELYIPDPDPLWRLSGPDDPGPGGVS